MEQRIGILDRRTSRNQWLKKLGLDSSAPLWVYFLLLILFAGGTLLVRLVSNSDKVIVIAGHPASLRTMTGAFSTIGNLSVILLVVLFKSLGFYTSLALLAVQFPSLLIRITQGNATAVAGLATNILFIVTIFIIFRYVSRADKFQERMRSQAVTDRLTGLPNRFAAQELMDRMIHKKQPFAIAVINLNSFRNINNTLGQQSGDQALVQIGLRMQKEAENASEKVSDFVASQNGDEFSVVLTGYESEEAVYQRISQYEKVLKEKLVVDDCDFFISGSIGYAFYPQDADNSEDLYHDSYSAMFHAKKKDRLGCICRFSKDMLDDDHSVEMERKIRDAIAHGRVFFHLQPQYDMNHRLSGFEALARMLDENGNLISPGEFIPVAEKVGLVEAIDREVLFASTAFLGKMIRETGSRVVLSVNASVRHLMRNDYLDEIRTALAESGFPANQLVVEITESIMIDSVERALERIRQLREMGIRIAVDDFGTGYSSLSYLNTFPVEVLKVDRSFIVQMDSGEASRQYVEAIIAMGHVMNLRVLAEGVEDQDQLETLRKFGCDFIQGFLWGRPMDPKDAARLMAA